MCKTCLELGSDLSICMLARSTAIRDSRSLPSNSSHTTSPVTGTTLTKPIRTRSSNAIPPIPLSTIATKALVEGGAVPGTTGSSLLVEDEPRDGSSTYLLISLPFTKHLRCSGEEMGQLSRERCITVITSFLQGGCFGLRDDADFVAE